MRGHGGLAATTCIDWDTSCRPSGDDEVRCSCRDGSPQTFCTEANCSDRLLDQEMCTTPCVDHDGLWGTACLFDQATRL